MMARPVAHYLQCFTDEPETAVLPEPVPDFLPIPTWQQEVNEDPAEDLLAQIEAARESGRTEGIETARAEFAVELEAERETHRRQLEAARQKWADEESTTFGASLAAGLAEIEARLAQGLSGVLIPFVTDVLRAQMIGELTETIAVLLANNEAVSIKVSGPVDLLDMLRDKLAGASASIDYEVTESVDVSVRIEQTTIETQLSAWIARISAEMEQPV
jgi:hypothetical protein